MIPTDVPTAAFSSTPLVEALLSETAPTSNSSTTTSVLSSLATVASAFWLVPSLDDTDRADDVLTLSTSPGVSSIGAAAPSGKSAGTNCGPLTAKGLASGVSDPVVGAACFGATSAADGLPAFGALARAGLSIEGVLGAPTVFPGVASGV